MNEIRANSFIIYSRLIKFLQVDEQYIDIPKVTALILSDLKTISILLKSPAQKQDTPEKKEKVISYQEQLGINIQKAY